MASCPKEGLGVGSLFSLDRAMLFKWFWRFFYNPNTLWVSVIRALHGHSGRLRDLSTVGAHYGLWKGIIAAFRQLKDHGVGLQVTYWVGSLFSQRDPRGGVETKQWKAISALIQAFIISREQDRLSWTLDCSDEFPVSFARYFLDGRSLFSGGISSRWNNFVPIKLNILLWRIALARIPTRDNLVSCEIILDSNLYPVCSSSM
ncbi:hypothetical protein Tco_1415146 [Tanacetum coccineum]